MEASLQHLLAKNDISAAVVAWLSDPQQGCTSLGIFANWCDSRSDVEARILRHTSDRDNQGQLVRLKQAWREADAHLSRSMRRSADGGSRVGVDDPTEFRGHSFTMLSSQRCIAHDGRLRNPVRPHPRRLL